MAKGDLRHGSAPLKEVLKAMVEDMGLGGKLKETQLLESIPDFLGPTINNLITDRFIYENKLYLKTHSATLRNELFVIKDALLQKIKEKVGDEVITDIVVR